MADVYVRHTLTGIVDRVPEHYLDEGSPFKDVLELATGEDYYCVDCGVEPPATEDATEVEVSVPDLDAPEAE